MLCRTFAILFAATLTSRASSAQLAPHAWPTDELHPSSQVFLESQSYEQCGLLHFSQGWLESLLDTAIRSGQQDTVWARVRLEDLRYVLSLVALHRSTVCKLAAESRELRARVALQTAEVKDLLLTATANIRGYELDDTYARFHSWVRDIPSASKWVGDPTFQIRKMRMLPDTIAYPILDSLFRKHITRSCLDVVLQDDHSALSARLRGHRPDETEVAALYDDAAKAVHQLISRSARYESDIICGPTNRLGKLLETAIQTSIASRADAFQVAEVADRLQTAATAIRGYQLSDTYRHFLSWLQDSGLYFKTRDTAGRWVAIRVSAFVDTSLHLNHAARPCLQLIRDPSALLERIRANRPEDIEIAARYDDAAEALQLLISASAYSAGKALCGPTDRLAELVEDALEASQPLILSVAAHNLASAKDKAQAAIDLSTSDLAHALLEEQLRHVSIDSLRALLPLDPSDLHRITEDVAHWQISDSHWSGRSFDTPLDDLLVTVSVRSACVDEPTGRCGSTWAVSTIGGNYVGSARDLPPGLKTMLDASVPSAVLCGRNAFRQLDIGIVVHASDGDVPQFHKGVQDFKCDRIGTASTGLQFEYPRNLDERQGGKGS